VGLGSTCACTAEVVKDINHHFLILHRRPQIPMPQHPPPHKRQRDGFTKEDSSNASGHVRKRISNASYHDVLKQAGALHERAAGGEGRDVAFGDELVGD